LVTQTDVDTYVISIPIEDDDAFNWDVAILDIEVIGMSAKVHTHRENLYEYLIVITDKQLTLLALKGYRLTRR